MGLRVKRQYGEVRDGVPMRLLPTVVVKRATAVQHFSQGFIDNGLIEGWMSLGRGTLVVHGTDGDVTYRLLRAPGAICCHCEAPVETGPPDEDGLTPGARHVRTAHPKTSSPDPTNPSGYRVENHYTAILQGSPVDRETPEERATMERGIRQALYDKLRAKYGARKAPPAISGGGNFVFNIAKGAVSGYYQRVDANDPANSAIIIMLLASTNIDTDAVMMDRDTVDALVGAGTACNEATNTNYARKVLTEGDLAAFAPDDVNDRVDLDIPDQTWTAVANDGTGNISDFVTAWDQDTTGGDDTNLVPMTLHDFALTPDGSDVTAQIATAGFFRAS